jgi:hypothetical protein
VQWGISIAGRGAAGVIGGAVGAYLGSTSAVNPTSDDDILRLDKAIGAYLASIDYKVQFQRQFDGPVLVHYTTPQGLAGILSSQQIFPSIQGARKGDARLGSGQYVTDIPPGSISYAALSQQLYSNPGQVNRVQSFIAIDVTNLPIVRDNSIPIAVIPNTRPLSIIGRIVAFVPNWEPK